MKLCKTCKHFYTYEQCRRLGYTINIVTGAKIWKENYCTMERRSREVIDRCGPDGQYWEANEPILSRIDKLVKWWNEEN